MLLLETLSKTIKTVLDIRDEIEYTRKDNEIFNKLNKFNDMDLYDLTQIYSYGSYGPTISEQVIAKLILRGRYKHLSDDEFYKRYPGLKK